MLSDDSRNYVKVSSKVFSSCFCKCSNPNKGRHTTKTIALDGEHIKMMCNGRGGGDRPCISIHKVLLGCTGGGRENPAHKQLVSFFMFEILFQNLDKIQ